jgi:pimeloyl-ACP methyl ester carboxylesterase
VIWGKRDLALEFEAAQLSLALCVEGELFPIEEATHWVQHDAREQVNSLIREFLDRHRHGPVA